MADHTLPVEPPIDLPAPHIAAGKNQVDKLSRLIQEGKETATDSKTQETVLHAAARNGAMKSAKWIVDSKAVDCLAYASNGYTAAHYAALYGHLGVLKILLTQDDRQMESKLVKQTTRTDENLSILSLAAIGGYSGVVEWLLNNFGQKADVPTSKGRHASHYAAAYGKLDVLTLLVQILGPDTAHVKDDQDTTPVFLAAQQGYLDVLSYLVNDLGADAEAEDKEGFNSIHAATQAGQTQCVKWLVAKLGSRYIVSQTGKDGATPLHMAAGSGNIDLLRYFLDTMENSNDVNVTDHSSYTPLHDASEEGSLQAVQMLLKHGAKTDIKNKDNQTAYNVAMEGGHKDIAALIRDYTMTRKNSKVSNEKNRRGPRTSRQETEELSSAIQQQAEVLEQRKEKQVSRQASLQDLGVESSPAKDTTPLIANKSEDDGEIEHTLGPHGDLYANPKKVRNKHRADLRQHTPDYDIEGFSSDPQSSVKNQRQATRPEYEGPYAVINDAESFVSRDRRSRVRRHYGQDTDSEFSAVTGRSGRRGPHHAPGWYPGAYDPVMFKKKGPRSVASSKHSSREGSQHSGYPPMMAPHPHMAYPYPYFAGVPYPGPGYWGHPQAAYGMPAEGGMQPAMIPPPGMPYGVYPHPRVHQQRASGKQQSKKKGKGSRHNKHDLSAQSSGLFSPKKHTDQDIGYGPSFDTPSAIKEDVVHDHPHAPPVTSPEGFMDDASDVNKFSSNIIMLKKSDQVREVEGITLNPSKAEPEVYDGRYDQYIMTDSEEEFEVDHEMNVGLLAEAAAILAIGCVAGLKGMSRVRKKNSSSFVMDKHHPPERHGLSSAWDDTHSGFEVRKRRGSIDKNIRGLSPEEFANVEDVQRETWAKDKPKAKQAKQVSQKKEKEKKPSAPSGETADVPNELITPELHKESYQSVSKHLGQKFLMDSLGAMHSSMLQIAPSSGMGSHMSLTKSSDDGGEGDDDDFGDTISLLEGKTPGAHSRRQRRTGGDETTSATEPSRVNTDVDEETGKSGKKKKKEKKEKKSKEKKEKVKDKKEKKTKKSSKSKSKKEPEENKDNELATGAASVKPVTDKENKPLVKHLVEEPKTNDTPVPQPKIETEVKKLETHVLPLTPPPAAKKEKHPRVLKGPKPEAEEKDKEHKRSDARPEIPKPVETAAQRKAPERPLQQTRQKPKEKIPTKPPPKVSAPPPAPKIVQQSSPREVVNDMSIFDRESSEEDEPVSVPISKPKTFIDDDFSKDLFGEDGLAELNEALRELEDIQASFPPDFQQAPNKKTESSKPKAVNGRESKRKDASAPVKKTSVSSTGRDEMRLFSYETGDIDFSDQDDIPSIPSSTKLTNGGAQPHQLYHMNSAGSISTGVQGESLYTSPFERNVLSILQALNETMQQMKNNPSVSQTEINQHERLQQEMIQNLISFSQRDPEVIQKLLTLLKDKQSPDSDNSAALEDLQQKLIEAQERQRMEASEHYRNQTQFHQEMQRRLEETAEMQMKGIQSNFDKYTRMMSEQMAEQMKRWQEEMKKREKEVEKKENESKKHRSKGKKKKHKKHHYTETSETGSSSEGEVESSGLIQPSAQIVMAKKPAIKTDTARIVRQDLLGEDDMRTSSMPKVLAEKKQQMLKRMETKISFDHSTDALKRFESVSDPPRDLDDTLEDSEEDEDEEMQFQHARPVTLKRAAIKTQLQNTGYTPNRPSSARQGVAEKRVVPVKGDERPEHSDLAGAGAELAAVLKNKQTF